MVSKALLVRLEAKPGKEDDVAAFLNAGLGIVQQEEGTRTWYGVRMGQSSFGIFDTFDGDAGRDAHLNGQVAAALSEKAPELLASPPSIEKLDVLASK